MVIQFLLGRELRIDEFRIPEAEAELRSAHAAILREKATDKGRHKGDSTYALSNVRPERPFKKSDSDSRRCCFLLGGTSNRRVQEMWDGTSLKLRH